MGKLLEDIKEKTNGISLSKRQIWIGFAVLMVLAILLGLGINSLLGSEGTDGLDSQSSRFTQDDITFSRKKEDTVISRGDLIIFKRDNALDGYLIKRVIAVGGDTVSIDDNGAVYVNNERYQTDKAYYKKDIAYPLTVPEGELFVLGDNGDASADSRMTYVGNVKIEEIEGVAE